MRTSLPAERSLDSAIRFNFLEVTALAAAAVLLAMLRFWAALPAAGLGPFLALILSRFKLLEARWKRVGLVSVAILRAEPGVGIDLRLTAAFLIGDLTGDLIGDLTRVARRRDRGGEAGRGAGQASSSVMALKAAGGGSVPSTAACICLPRALIVAECLLLPPFRREEDRLILLRRLYLLSAVTLLAISSSTGALNLLFERAFNLALVRVEG